MTDIAPDLPPRSEWSPVRRELHRRLTERSESLGELYSGALSMFALRLPGRIRFVAHAVREIRNRLPEVFAGHQSPPRVDPNRLDAVAAKWKKVKLPVVESDISRSQPESVEIPFMVVRAVDELLRTHVTSRHSTREAARCLFAAISPENQQRASVIEPVVKQWLKVTEYFMTKVHDNGRHPDDYQDHQDVDSQGH